MFTIDPVPARHIKGPNTWIAWNVPSRFTSTVRRKIALGDVPELEPEAASDAVDLPRELRPALVPHVDSDDARTGARQRRHPSRAELAERPGDDRDRAYERSVMRHGCRAALRPCPES